MQFEEQLESLPMESEHEPVSGTRPQDRDSGSVAYESEMNQQLRWRFVKSSGLPPKARSLHTAVVIAEGLYVFGGYDGISRVNDLHKFDFRSSAWAQLPSSSVTGLIPSPRDRHVAVSYADRYMLIFGGYDGTNRVNDLWQFDTVTGLWTPIHASGVPPTARHSHNGVEYQGCLYIFGGYDGSYRNDMYEFNVSRKTWHAMSTRGAVPRARYRASLCVHKDSALLFGGHDGTRHMNDLHRFSFETLYWTLIDLSPRVQPTPVFGYSDRQSQPTLVRSESTGSNSRGATGSGVSGSRSRTTHSTALPTPRDSHVAVVVNDSMYVFGGSTGMARNDLFEYRILSEDWIEHFAVSSEQAAPQATSVIAELTSTPSHSSVVGMSSVFRGSTPAAQGTSILTPLSSSLNAFRFMSEEGVAAESAVPPVLASPGTRTSPFEQIPGSSPSTNSCADNAIPTPRFCHTGVVHKTTFYIFGGYDGAYRLNDFRAINCAEGSLVDIPVGTLVEDLRLCVGDPHYSDASFVVEGQVVHAHKVIICRRCEFFRAMFQSQLNEGKQGSVVMHDISRKAFLALLNFLYTDQILESDISTVDQTMDVFAIADRFGVERLKCLCESAVMQNISESNAPTILQAADRYKAMGLRKRALDFILRNFDAVSKHQAFESMARQSVDLLLEVLKRR